MAKRAVPWVLFLLLASLSLSACMQKYQLGPSSADPPPTWTFTATVPTGSETPTPTPQIVCTVTPVVPPTEIAELEPVGVGGQTGAGTNESCGSLEPLGTVTAGTSTVVYGNLSYSGTVAGNYDWANDDFDGYRFTAGSSGTYTFYLDCYSRGSDGIESDLVLFDDACPSLNQLDISNMNAPVQNLSRNLNVGESFTIVIVGWSGPPNNPYRLTINGP